MYNAISRENRIYDGERMRSETIRRRQRTLSARCVFIPGSMSANAMSALGMPPVSCSPSGCESECECRYIVYLCYAGCANGTEGKQNFAALRTAFSNCVSFLPLRSQIKFTR